MAGIDKIYLPKEQGILFLNWAKDNNDKCLKESGFNLLNCFYDFQEYEVEIQPITNTNVGIDRWLILNCPFYFVQEQLANKYGYFYKEVLNGTDTYSKPYIYEKSTKVKINNEYRHRFKRSLTGSKYWIQMGIIDSDNYWWYNEKKDRWVNEAKELYPTDTNTAHYGKSIKAIIRKIRKWGLPKGLTLFMHGRLKAESFIIKTK